MEAPLSKATKNNDSMKEKFRFFDKWRTGLLDSLSTHIYHQNLNITWIHSTNSTCLSNCNGSDFFKLLHRFYRQRWHFIKIKTIWY